MGIKKKTERREATREVKALRAAKIEKSIEKELLDRLKRGAYGDAPLNVNEDVWNAVLENAQAKAPNADTDDLALEEELSDEEAEEDIEEMERNLRDMDEEDDAYGQREFVSDDEESDEESADDFEVRCGRHSHAVRRRRGRGRIELEWRRRHGQAWQAQGADAACAAPGEAPAAGRRPAWYVPRSLLTRSPPAARDRVRARDRAAHRRAGRAVVVSQTWRRRRRPLLIVFEPFLFPFPPGPRASGGERRTTAVKRAFRARRALHVATSGV